MDVKIVIGSNDYLALFYNDQCMASGEGRDLWPRIPHNLQGRCIDEVEYYHLIVDSYSWLEEYGGTPNYFPLFPDEVLVKIEIKDLEQTLLKNNHK